MPVSGRFVPVLMLFIEQKLLAKLGYTFNGEDLDDYFIECFLTIEGEINKVLYGGRKSSGTGKSTRKH